MKTRLLIIIGIVLASISSGVLAYVISVQSQCESLLGDTHYPRPLTLWNCLDYLQRVDHPPPKSSTVKSVSDSQSEPEPIPDSESVQRQKQQQAKIHTQEIIITDTRGYENKINAIKEYRDEFESGYFLGFLEIIHNKQEIIVIL